VTKLKVCREWGEQLDIGAVDVDGSRVRKGVGRLINEFQKAFAFRDQGNRTKEDVVTCRCMPRITRPTAGVKTRRWRLREAPLKVL
jgi:hypothetical protein